MISTDSVIGWKTVIKPMEENKGLIYLLQPNAIHYKERIRDSDGLHWLKEQ